MSQIDDIALALAERRSILSVAVDGRTASGKTTFATQLAERINVLGRPAVHAQLDGFHNPRSVRYARGRLSAEGYYRDARNLTAVRNALVRPFKNGESYRLASLDLETDKPVTPAQHIAPEGAVLVVDGSFLQRPELSDLWDAVIFLDVDEKTSLSRGVARDGEILRAAYETRYLPAWRIYLSKVDPRASANWIVPN